MEKREYTVMSRVEGNHFWYRGMRRISEQLLHRYLTSSSGNIILDAGCGTGGSLLFLKKFGQTYGVDVSPYAISLCKKRGLKNISVHSIDALPFRDSSFDLITCFDVLPHLQVKNDSAALKELHRVLKPGGILLLRAAAYNWLYGYHDTLVHNKRRYTKPEIEKLLYESGLSLLKSTYVNFFLFPVILLKRLIIDFVFGEKKKSSDVEPVHPFLNILLEYPLLIESFLINYVNLPFGLSVVAVGKKKVRKKSLQSNKLKIHR